MKLSTRWTNSPDCYDYHMGNKFKIVRAMSELFSSKTIGYKHLSGLIVRKEWCVPEPNDFPNYPFVYNLAKEYLEFTKTIEVPFAEGMILENVVKYLASLAKQDPAYYTRFNGIMFRILHDYSRGTIKDRDNLKYLKMICDWWDLFDGRERNHDLYRKFLDHIIEKYETDLFYSLSIDWILNWIGAHQCDFVYADDMNPKKWYGNCGIGLVDNLTQGGMG